MAARGFVVDQTFHDQTAANEARFADITADPQAVPARRPPPAVGSVFRNPALADTYDRLGRKGVDWLYDGRLGREIVHTVQAPAEVTRPRPATSGPGLMTAADLRALPRGPTRADRACATAGSGLRHARRPPAAARPSARR